MGTHMKTTLDIADPLIKAAKARAKAEATTLRALVERGLQHVLSQAVDPHAFRLRDASVDGKGFHPEALGRNWDELRAKSYEGHGG